jgi:hypothetical protein
MPAKPKPVALPAKALEALARKHGVSGKGTKRQVLRRIGKQISPTFNERLHLGSGKAPPTGSFVVDSFTEAKETLLNEHVGETGATWTAHPSNTGEAKVAQNSGLSYARSSKGAGTIAIYYASGIPASAEYDIAAERWRQNGLGISGRLDTEANTHYWAGRANPERYVLDKYVAGTATQLGSFSIASASSYDALVLSLANAKKALFLNGEEIISSTDNVITAPGRVGLWGGVNATAGDRGINSLTATDAGGGGEAKSGSASVTGGGSATASGQKLALGVVSASGGGSVAETGQKVGQGTASASGGGTAALSGSKLAQGVALVTGGGSSSASGVAEEEAEGAEGSAAVSGGGSATASGAKRAGGAGSVSGGGGAAATANKTARAAVFVAGGGQVAGTGAGGRTGSATVTGGGLVVSAGTAIRLGEVVISGGGTVSALGKRAQSGVLGHPYGDPALRGEATGALRREATGEVLGASRGALRGPVRSIP